MPYYAFYYLATKVVTDYKASLPVEQMQWKNRLVQLLDDMKKIEVDENIPDTWRDYAKTANLLLLLQGRRFPEGFAEKLQPLKKVALSERHVADFYLTAMAETIKTAKDKIAAMVVQQIFLSEENIEPSSTITDGTTNLCDKLKSLAEPMTYADVKKLLDDMLRTVKQQFSVATENDEKVEFSRICSGIITFFIPQLITNARNYTLEQCVPATALTDAGRAILFTEFDQQQLRNIVEYYTMNIKQIPNVDHDQSLKKLKAEWSAIEAHITKGKFAKAAKLILDFHRGADLKYPELFEDEDIGKVLQHFKNRLCAICDLQAPSMCKAMSESHALLSLRATVSLEDGEEGASSPLQALLNALSKTSEQDCNDLTQVANKIRNIFKEKPYATLTDVPFEDLVELRRVIDRCCQYDKQRMTPTILNLGAKETAVAAVNVKVLLDKMVAVCDQVAERFSEHHAMMNHDRLLINLPNDLQLTGSDPLMQDLQRLSNPKSPQDLLSNFKSMLYAVGCEINHDQMTAVTQQRFVVRCVLKKYKALIAAKDFKQSAIIRRHLLAVLNTLHPDEKVLCLMDLMHEQLQQHLQSHSGNPQAQHTRRVEYIIDRLNRIASRVGNKIPDNKQVYYADATRYSAEATMMDMVQQLHKELILLQHSTLKADLSEWKDYAKSFWYGDDGDALQVLLEEILLEYQVYFPKECQQVIGAMHLLRSELGVNKLLGDSKKCNAAQQKREPENELLKQVLTH